jgi:predicted Zn-dependent peptidase
LEARETEQCNLCLATKGLAHSDPRRYALDLLNTILGGGMSSRLFVEVRERLGLVYDIHSYADRLDDTGMLVIYAGMDPPACLHVLRVILAALHRLRDEPVDNAELSRAKNQFRGRLLLGLEDTSSVAHWYGAQELLLHRIYTPEEVLAAMDAVTADDLQRLAAELFRDEYLRLALIGPHNDEREFEELLHLP